MAIVMILMLCPIVAFAADPPKPPTIVHGTMSKTTGYAGLEITMAIADYTTDIEIYFGSTRAVFRDYWDGIPGHLIVTVPAGSGAVNVTVSNLIGTGEATETFTYENTPTITSITPAIGPTNVSTWNGTIRGGNFSAGATVSFAGLAASNVVVVNSNTITCTAPVLSSSGTKLVKVTSGGIDSNTVNYEAIFGSISPTIVSISPNSGPITGGRTVTITGTNLWSLSSVLFGGAAATNIVETTSGTTITCVTPANAGGAVNVLVRNSTNNYITFPSGYAYYEPIVITQPPQNVSITEGDSASFSVTAPLATGFQWQVSTNGGTNWTDVPGATGDTLTIPNVQQTSNGWHYWCVLSNANESDVKSAAALLTVTGTNYGITLNPSTDKTFASEDFGYSAPTPHSVSISNNGLQDAGALTIALEGSNPNAFELSKTALNVTALSSDSFTVVPRPNRAPGTYIATVRITSPYGIYESFNVEFTVSATAPGPPQNVKAYPGDGELSIGWDAPASDGGSPITGYETSLDGTNWNLVNNSAYTYTFPGLTNGTPYAMQVRAINALGASSIVTKTGIPIDAPFAPLATNISPNLGPSSGGTTVTITGTNLSDITDVTFGGASASDIRVVNHVTSITCVTPPHSPGLVDVTLTNPGGTQTIPLWYTYTGSRSISVKTDAAPTTPQHHCTITAYKEPGHTELTKSQIPCSVSNGRLTATITKEIIQAALEKAGKSSNPALSFIVQDLCSFSSQTISFSAKELDLLKSSGVESVQVQTGIFLFKFDDKAIAHLMKQTSDTVSISANASPSKNGRRPAFDVNIKFKKDSVIYSAANLGNGTMTFGIRYTPDASENIGNLYVGKFVSGKWQWLESSSYDNGWMNWSGNSCSVYGVGCETPAPLFTDAANHWAKDYIDFVASRGLLTGTSAATFAPDIIITRGMFITALGRLSGADVSGYKTSGFSDVAADSYCLPFIEWAVDHKIASGIGGGKFAPESVISREDMAMILHNYAKATNYKLPITSETFKFTDADKISAGAKDAITAIQRAGIIVGKSGGVFDPKGNLTRAEASAILQRFVELVIDPASARGWTQNDSGEWMYYGTMTGELLTGWQTLGGDKYYFDDKGTLQAGKWIKFNGKWYYLCDDGKLAVSATIDGYGVNADGARQ